MKTVLQIALFLLLVEWRGFSQGTIYFNTRYQGRDAPVELERRGGPGPGPEFSAALWLVAPGGSLSFIPSSLTVFHEGTSSAPILAKYIVPVVAMVPGNPGEFVTLRMRAWETAAGSYERAMRRGESEDFGAILGSPETAPGDIPASLTGFVVTVVPEPAAISLLLLAAAAFGAFRSGK